MRAMEPDNHVNANELSHMEKELLEKILAISISCVNG